MYAYFVSKKGAQKIIELYETKKIDMQIDSQISLKMHKEPGSISVFSTRSRIVNSGPFGTNIQMLLKPEPGVDPFELV